MENLLKAKSPQSSGLSKKIKYSKSTQNLQKSKFFYLLNSKNMFTMAFLEFIFLFFGFSFLATFGLREVKKFERSEKRKKHLYNFEK